MSVSISEKRATFRQLHQSGCFVIPNPWDVGSARALQHLGYKALASTSAGYAWSTGRADNKAKPLYDRSLAIERIAASRAAIDASGADVMLVGRCESFFVGQPDLDLVLDRIVAYADAGADCLYAPGIRTKEQVAAVVKAVHPKPVNLLIGWPGGLTVRDATDLGVRRISIGGAMARTAWGAFMRGARDILDNGSFDSFADGYPAAELNKMFGA